MIAVTEETDKTMKVTWQPAPGNVLNYRVTYKPKAGGRQLAAKVPGGNTSTVLRRLTPLTTYDITVVPVYRSGEGKPRDGEGRTCTLVSHSPHGNCSCFQFHILRLNYLRINDSSKITSVNQKELVNYLTTQFLITSFSSIVTPYKGPRNLKTSEPSRTSFRVTWDHAPGDVRGYKVLYHPVGEDIDLGELRVGPYDNTVVLEELRCVFWAAFLD